MEEKEEDRESKRNEQLPLKSQPEQQADNNGQGVPSSGTLSNPDNLVAQQGTPLDQQGQKDGTKRGPRQFQIHHDFIDKMIKQLKINKNSTRGLNVVEPELTHKEIEDKNEAIKSGLKEDDHDEIDKEVGNLDDPFSQIFLAKKAYLDQYYELSDLMVCCPIYRRYRVALEFAENQVYPMFNIKEKYSSNFAHDCLGNQCRAFTIDMSHRKIKGMGRKRFVNMTKKMRCGIYCFCACCSRPTLEIKSPLNPDLAEEEQEQELYGRVIEKRTVCSPTFDLYYKDEENPSWCIKGSCCQCGYGCPEMCGGCCGSGKAKFHIYKYIEKDFGNGEKEIVEEKQGMVVKNSEYGSVWKPDSERYEIDFPDNVDTPQEKLLMVAGTLFLAYMYFQKTNVKKRCHNNEDV